MKYLFVLSVIAFLVCATPSFAKGPFEGFEGSWRGSGTLTPVGKKPERTTCSRQGSITNAGAGFSLSFFCTSASENFSLTCAFSSSGKSVSGTCSAYNVGATVLGGTVSNGVLQATVRTAVGSSASVRVTSRSMFLSSPNAKKISHLAVNAR